MIKFKDMLLEQTRSRKLMRKWFNRALYRGRFTTAYHKFLENDRIYRGVHGLSEYPLWAVNPKTRERKSRNTSNFYTMLVDNLPSWKDYPKRSRSIICTSDITRAYGGKSSTMLVFPENKARIGVCPSDDFWDSFPVVLHRLDLDSMDAFNSVFFGILEPLVGYSMPTLEFKNYRKFIELLNKHVPPEKVVESPIGSADWKIPVVQDLEKKLREGHWEEYFDELLNPERNGFRLETIETYKNFDYSNNELWTDGISLLVSPHEMDRLMVSPTEKSPVVTVNRL